MRVLNLSEYRREWRSCLGVLLLLALSVPETGMAAKDIAAVDRLNITDNESILQAREQYDRGNFEEALAYLLKAVEADPENAVIHFHLGLTYQGMLRYPEAEASLARSVELDPSKGNTYAHLGEILYRLGKYPEARLALKEAEAKGDKPAYTAYMKGLVLTELADYPGAVEALQQAQELYPANRQKAAYAMGMAYSKQNDKQAAEKAFREAIAMDAGSPAGVFADLGLQSLNRPDKRPLHLDFGYGFHYDDNVILKPGPAVSAVFPSGQKDFAHVLAVHAGYAPESRGVFGIRADGTYYKSIHHKLSNMDVDGASLSLTPSLSGSEGTLSVEGKTEYYWVGRNRYLSTIGVYPDFSFSMGETHHGVLHAGYQSKQFMHGSTNIAEDRDAINSSGGYTHYIYNEDRNAYLSLDYTFDTDRARGDNWDDIGHQVSVSALYPFGNGFGLRFNGDYYRQNYRKIHTVFGQKRRDRIFTLAPVLTYDLKWANLLLQYTYVKAQSNLQVYRYSRNVVGMGFEYSY